MTFQPKCLSGTVLTTTQRAIEAAGPQRLWNIQSAYNAVCVAAPCHAALSPGRLRRKVRAAEERQAQARTPWETFTRTVASDARRGAYLAATATRPATWTLDALVGTGRAPKPTGTPAVRMLKTVDALGTHFTNTGVLGAALLGTAVGSAFLGAAAGCLYGLAKGLSAIPFAWITDRRSPWVTLQRALLRGTQCGASKALIADVGILFLQIQALRLGTAGIKLGIAAVGTLIGAAVGVAHGAEASYSVAALRPPLQESYSLLTHHERSNLMG